MTGRAPARPEALEYFRFRGLKIGFDYRDVRPEEHARFFTVAKAMEIGLLRKSALQSTARSARAGPSAASRQNSHRYCRSAAGGAGGRWTTR